MKQNGDVYEYIAGYVDDLAIAMKDPKPFIKTLKEKYNFHLKGTGPLEFHLGTDFFHDDEGTLCMAPCKYIEHLIDGYENTFGEKPTQRVYSPLKKGDHPELDDTEFLDKTGIQ